MLGEWRDTRKRRTHEQQKQQQQQVQQRQPSLHGEDQEQPSAAVRPSPKVRVVRSGHKASDKANGRERICKHKYSNYCVDDVLADNEGVDEEETTTMMGVADTTDTLMNISAEGK